MSLRRLGFAACVVLVTASAASAEDRFWANAAGGAFDDRENWSGGVPGPFDTAVFDLAATYNIDPFTGATNERAVVRRGIVRFQLDPAAIYALIGTSPIAPGLVVGEADDGIAQLVVLAGSLTARFADVGQLAGADGTLTLIDGASFALEEQLHLGDAGKGVLSLGEGAQLTCGRAVLGQSMTGDGRARVAGEETAWRTDELTVGQRGNGEILITDGAEVVSERAIIAQNIGATGFVTVRGAGTRWRIDGPLDVAFNGEGMLRIEDGARVEVDGFVSLATIPGKGAFYTNGVIVVTGAGSELALTGDTTFAGLVEGPDLTSFRMFRGGALSAAWDIEVLVRIQATSTDDWQDTPAVRVGRTLLRPIVFELASGFVPPVGTRYRIAATSLDDEAEVNPSPSAKASRTWAEARTPGRLDLVAMPLSCLDDGTGVDCNDNGIEDDCDLEYGASTDCNGNGTPDDCDIAAGLEADCNLNGVPDACEIADGAVTDCDGDGVPDSCDPVVGVIDDPVAGVNRFGDAADIDGDTAVVGAPRAAGGGAVYVYARTSTGGWDRVQTIAAPDGVTGDDFGTAVALRDDLLVVGAFGVQVDGEDARGAAFVFRSSGGLFALEETLRPDPGEPADRIGSHVAVDGDDVLVGALLIGGSDLTGHFFRRIDGTWTAVRRVALASPSSPLVGAVVALDDGRAIIGSRGGLGNYRRTGDAWIGGETLQPPTGGQWGSNLGVGLAMRGDLLVVAGNDDIGSRVLYLLRDDGTAWHRETILRTLAGVRDVATDGATIAARTTTTTHLYQLVNGTWSQSVSFPSGTFSLFGFKATAIDGPLVLSGGGNASRVDGVDLNRLDTCTCAGDVDRSGAVDANDLTAVLVAWGPCTACPEDVDVDGSVGFEDLLIVLFGWGSCAR